MNRSRAWRASAAVAAAAVAVAAAPRSAAAQAPEARTAPDTRLTLMPQVEAGWTSGTPTIGYSISVAARRHRWEARLSHAGFSVVVPCADVSPSKCRDGAGPLSEAGVGYFLQQPARGPGGLFLGAGAGWGHAQAAAFGLVYGGGAVSVGGRGVLRLEGRFRRSADADFRREWGTPLQQATVGLGLGVQFR